VLVPVLTAVRATSSPAGEAVYHTTLVEGIEQILPRGVKPEGARLRLTATRLPQESGHLQLSECTSRMACAIDGLQSRSKACLSKLCSVSGIVSDPGPRITLITCPVSSSFTKSIIRFLARIPFSGFVISSQWPKVSPQIYERDCTRHVVLSSGSPRHRLLFSIRGKRSWRGGSSHQARRTPGGCRE
jgi:hypothetical protein